MILDYKKHIFPSLNNQISVMQLEGAQKTFVPKPIVGLIAAIIIIIVTSKRATSTTYTLSSYGISKEESFLIHRMIEIPFDKIAHITITRDVLGKIFHFGTVTIDSASISFNSLDLTGVREPEELRRLISGTGEKALAN